MNLFFICVIFVNFSKSGRAGFSGLNDDVLIQFECVCVCVMCVLCICIVWLMYFWNLVQFYYFDGIV